MLSIYNTCRHSDKFLPAINNSTISKTNKENLKKAAKIICKYYDKGKIEEEVFIKIIERLMEASIVNGFSQKIESKTQRLDKKITHF